MENHAILLQLIAVLLGARMLGGAAAHFGIPPVLGEMLAGIILGPSLLGVVEPGEILALLAEIGVILLLFDIGSGTDFERLLRSGYRSFLVASGGFVAPLVAGFSLAYWGFGLPWHAAWFVGGTLTATSIGITMRILKDLGHERRRESDIILGAAVLDDVLGVLLIAVLHQYAVVGEIRLLQSGQILLVVLAFVVLAPIAARIFALAIERFDISWRKPGLIPTSVIALALFFAWLATQAGAPALLGGFAAGLALSRRFRIPHSLPFPHEFQFDRKVRGHMGPIIHLMVPIFFVNVGVSLDLREIDWTSSSMWLFGATILAVAVAGKLVGAMTLPRRAVDRWAVGIAMIPRGEVGIIFAEMGRAGGVLDQATYAALLLVIALTTLGTPLVLRTFYRYHAPTDGPGH